jgi:hypothetical protein
MHRKLFWSGYWHKRISISFFWNLTDSRIGKSIFLCEIQKNTMLFDEGLRLFKSAHYKA